MTFHRGLIYLFRINNQKGGTDKSVPYYTVPLHEYYQEHGFLILPQRHKDTKHTQRRINHRDHRENKKGQTYRSAPIVG
jgi:hypothetical protein